MKTGNENKKMILYMHAGSGNHGCEAIACSLSRLIPDSRVLISYYADEDRKYSLKDIYEIFQERSFNDHKIAHVLYYGYRLLTKDKESFIRYRFRQYLDKRNRKYIDADTGINTRYPVAISIGGDNYCYDVMLNDLELSNSAFNAQGTRTILLGCSIEHESLKNKAIVNDLSKYHTIIARESLTYEALTEVFDKPAGEIGRGKGESIGQPKIILLPDPAFSLEVKKPDDISALTIQQEGTTVWNEESSPLKDMVGINISPMIQSNEAISGITIKNYEKLIEHIINETDMNAILIPHVVWDRNDDRKPIDALYEKYSNTGKVYKIRDTECRELKYIISKCRFFVGARTHSTIAAYSTCVPTLVVGYSVKARGIARDLFDTDDTSPYVLPVQNLKGDTDLTNAFKYLQDNEARLREKLQKKIPDYISRTSEYKKVIKSIIDT